MNKKEKILIIFNENNLNNFFLDYLFYNLKNRIINILKSKFIINILCFTNLKEVYKYDFMNRKISYNILKKKLDELNIEYKIKTVSKINNIITSNNTICINDIYEEIDIDYIIQYIIKNINSNYDYIFYIPPNSYTYDDLNINLINNNIILIDNDSNSFIMPYKYIFYINHLFNKTYNIISNAKYIRICFKHAIELKSNIKTFTTNDISILKSNIGIGKLIINDITDLHKLNFYDFKKNNLNVLYEKYKNSDNNIVIVFVGQVRTFLNKEVYTSIKKYIIDDLESKHINYMLFFYVENKMEYYWQKIDKKKYNISKDKIESIIKTITDKYILNFYDTEKIKKEMNLITRYPFNLQLFLLYKSYLMIKEYEKENNISFKYLIKVRPDLIFNEYITSVLNMSGLNKHFIFQWDIVYIFPKYLFDLIEKIYYLSIYPRLEDLYNSYFSKYISRFIDKKNLNSIGVNIIERHKYAHICMWLNNIPIEKHIICAICRP